jgi:hypothetical protein
MNFGLGTLGCGILLAAFAASLGRRLRSGLPSWLIPVGAFAGALVPVEGVPIAGYLHGLASDLSVTTLVLVGCGLVARTVGLRFADRRDLFAVLAVVLAGAAFLYPMTLGLTRYDPYRLGYRSEGFLLILALLALASWLLRYRLLPAVLSCSVVAFGLSLGESQNLWDYLIDPFLTLFAAVWIGRELRSSVRSPNLGK